MKNYYKILAILTLSSLFLQCTLYESHGKKTCDNDCKNLIEDAQLIFLNRADYMESENCFLISPEKIEELPKEQDWIIHSLSKDTLLACPDENR